MLHDGYIRVNVAVVYDLAHVSCQGINNKNGCEGVPVYIRENLYELVLGGTIFLFLDCKYGSSR